MLTGMQVSTENNKNIGAKIPEKEYNKISELVSDGLFLNISDFVRQAITDKLKTYDNIITLRDIPYEQQREEIIDYVKQHPNVDAVDIADELMLDAFKVNEILVELIEEKKFKKI